MENKKGLGNFPKPFLFCDTLEELITSICFFQTISLSDMKKPWFPKAFRILIKLINYLLIILKVSTCPSSKATLNTYVPGVNELTLICPFSAFAFEITF